MKPFKAKTTLLLVVLAASIQTTAAKTIQADHPEILVQGSKYLQRSAEKIKMQRHDEAVLQIKRKELGLNPSKARNTSGIVLAFSTDSQTIKANFHISYCNYLGSGFGVFENGKLIDEFHFSPKIKEASLEITSKSVGTSRFEISLPSFATTELLNLEIEEAAVFGPTPPNPRKVYVALGDSISHGVGQLGTTHKTWPFLLSQTLNHELFNLAVGGAKISIPVGKMLKDWEKIDLITLLVGYNDLHFDGKTPEEYVAKYGELLDAVRENHAQTPIFCITPLYTRKTVSAKTGATIQQYRDLLTTFIQNRQKTDKNLHLIAGDTISSEKHLRPESPKDPVHLGVEGARMLAESLHPIIEKALDM